jgi:hypothetical protein
VGLPVTEYGKALKKEILKKCAQQLDFCVAAW